MTNSGKFIVTVGLLLYWVASVLAIVLVLANRTDAFRGVFLVAVSAPWSFVSLLLPSNLFDGPWGEVWAIGVGLTGIALNSVLFWLFIKMTVGRRPHAEHL